MSKLIYPLVSVAQSFTDTQKAQARTNIGAAAEADLQTEISNRSTADTALSDRINTEITNRTAADGALNASLTTEINARQSADTTLTAAVAGKQDKLTAGTTTATAYTFLASDANTCHIVNTSAATTRTVPSDTTAPDLAIGDSIEVVNVGTGTVTFAAASGVTLLSSLTLVMYGQYSVCMLRKIAANTWILTGERTAV